MNKRIKVCLIVEGAYPYIVGGVSIWLHQIITNLPHIDFVLWTIVTKRKQKYKSWRTAYNFGVK